MPRPDTPPNHSPAEVSRLQRLRNYRILDTESEAAFDRVAAMASRIFRVPTSLISLVDEHRQWFKACHGFDRRGTDRSLSFCAHAIESDDVLVVPDATSDPRFATNELVTGPHHVRFYAGAPLKSPDGHRLGTLCILDSVPRMDFSEEERRTLQDLADSVMTELELRLALAERTRSETLAAAILNSALDAVVTINPAGEVTEWNPAAEQLFGYPRQAVLGRDLATLIIPDRLRRQHRDGLHRYLVTGNATLLGRRVEVMAMRRGGAEFPCELAITPFVLDGQQMFTASMRDLTAQHQAHAALTTGHNLLQAVVEGVPEALFVKDRELRYVMINAAGAAQIGQPVANILGRTDAELFPPETMRLSTLRDRQVLSLGQTLHYEVDDLLPSGERRTFRSSKGVYRDAQGHIAGLIGLAIDITDQKATEALVQEQKRALEGRIQERTRELDASKLEVIERLARAAEHRDDDTGEHVRRVARTSVHLAERLGWPAEHLRLLERAATLHDVGKIGIPDSILLKPGRLDADEMAVIRTHARIGAEILANGKSALIRMAETIALTHHERWDGQGYPHGLAGEAIPLVGRIVAVADVLDALTSERPYKRAWTREEALAEIRRQAGRQFDPAVVAVLDDLG